VLELDNQVVGLVVSVVPDTIGVLAALTRRAVDQVEWKSLTKAFGSGEAPVTPVPMRTCSARSRPRGRWTGKAIERRDPSMMFYLRFVVCKGPRASHRWTKIGKTINLTVEAQARASTLPS